MSLVDALNRIAEIQAQLAPRATVPAAAQSPVAAGNAAPAAGAPLATASAVTAPSFANVLAAQQVPSLPPRANAQLTSGQRTFATTLAAQTGLDARVIAAWLLAEQSGGAATAREQAGNHNWLNIGYTDSGTYGASASAWRDPVSAANATAGWLKGQDTVDGYGRASAGVQSILTTAGQPPEAQIAALQRSGWASSGYPDLPVLLRQVS